jgi:formylglycine-generating enzyme required for sulfatase activity
MSLRSAVSRADLLLTLRRTGAMRGETAAACGFEAEKMPAAEPGPVGGKPGNDPKKPGETVNGDNEPVVVPEFPKELPRLKFLMPVKLDVQEPPPERRAEELPAGIPDERLAIPRGVAPLPLRPLVRWARLAPFLKRVLGRTVPGVRIDHRRLAYEAGRGLPLTALPRLPRRVWAGHVVVLRDDTMEMAPFRRDASWLLQRLRRERGAVGLRVERITGAPSPSVLGAIPADVPVLALSCMGQYAGSERQRAAWLAVARCLKWRGNAFYALAPVPRRCQDEGVAAVWPVAVWDAGGRLPRHTARRGVLPPEDRRAATERLLDLLSPATFVEAPLLRAVRQVVRGADAEAEWAAWHDPLHWPSPDAFEFIHPEKEQESAVVHAGRLVRRRDLPLEETAAATDLIARQHAAHSIVIAEEARLRALLYGTRDAEQLQGVREIFEKVLERLRVLATLPGSRVGKQSGLAAWFLRMVSRLPPEVRADPAVAEVIARGLAAAHVFLETESANVPEGIDSAAFSDETRAAAGRFRDAHEYRVELRGDQWAAQWALVPSGTRQEQNAVPLSLLHVSSRSVVFAADEGNFFERVDFKAGPIVLPALTAPAVLGVDGGRERLRLEPKERPWWACRMQYDRRGFTAFLDLNGLRVPLRWQLGEDALVHDGGSAQRTGAWVAEHALPWGRLYVDEFGPAVMFKIDSAVFTFRWIPAGTFLMGSPEDEPGRNGNEGPQHQVRISRGYWMGDASVTQEQWRAVIETAREKCPDVWKSLGEDRQPAATPSNFKGHGDLPVENVTWHDSEAFCRLLRALIPAGPDFGLPTEAQWEYACRAGTQSAFNDGSLCTLPQGLDPALDALGWFDDNSGGETHPVRQKKANVWGLHDMHGNVWEWCRDQWDAAAYGKRIGMIVDPELGGDGSVGRVVRGGSWFDRARYCRAAIRYGFDPGFRWRFRGLRLSAGQEPVGAERPSRRAEGRSPEAAAERPKGMLRRLFKQ